MFIFCFIWSDKTGGEERKPIKEGRVRLSFYSHLHIYYFHFNFILFPFLCFILWGFFVVVLIRVLLRTNPPASTSQMMVLQL